MPLFTSLTSIHLLNLLSTLLITKAALAHTYATSGARDSARDLLTELVTADDYRPSFEIAKVHLALGDADQAIDWLERAHDEHAHSMAFLMVDPQLEALHSDPRFIRLVAEVGPDRRIGDGPPF